MNALLTATLGFRCRFSFLSSAGTSGSDLILRPRLNYAVGRGLSNVRGNYAF